MSSFLAELSCGEFSGERGWFLPVFTYDRDIHLILVSSFLAGVLAAHGWSADTGLALACSLAGIQALHSLTMQIRQRKHWNFRYLLWASVYAALAIGLAAYLYFRLPALVWIYTAAVVAVAVKSVSTFSSRTACIWDELLATSAICLPAPFAMAATTKAVISSMAGLWIVTALFFGSAVITVRLRNPIDRSWKPVITYHGVSLILILSMWSQGFATVSMAAAFAAALLKLLFILWQFNWYERTPIENVALFDALGAIFLLPDYSRWFCSPVVACADDYRVAAILFAAVQVDCDSQKPPWGSRG